MEQNFSNQPTGFGKMKLLGDGMNVESIAAALETSELLVLNESKTGVKRKYPLPTEDPAAERTIYAAAFNSEASRAGVIAKIFSFLVTLSR